MNFRAYKISGRRYFEVLLETDGAAEPLTQAMLSTDSAVGPWLYTLLQIEAKACDGLPESADFLVDGRSRPPGYVATWRQHVTVQTATPSTVRLLLIEGHTPVR